VRAQLATLSANITGIFAAAGLDAVCVPAFPGWITHSAPLQPQKIARANLSGIFQVISDGFIPIIHGDCVFDDAQKYSILSGDLIVAHMAQVFQPKVPHVYFMQTMFECSRVSLSGRDICIRRRRRIYGPSND
jgi:isopentenyl phosphate kinase